jgi:hypothetical protein
MQPFKHLMVITSRESTLATRVHVRKTPSHWTGSITQALNKGTGTDAMQLKGQGAKSRPSKDGGPLSSNKSNTTHSLAATMIILSKQPVVIYTISALHGQ